MAVTIVDHRIIVNEADATTNWTGTTTLFTADPTPIESTGELGATVGVATFDSYVAYSDDLSNAVIYCWVFSRLALGDTASAGGGLMVSVGEATNLGAWKVAGADLAAFRHDAGPTGWQCPALDTTSLPASPLSRAGSAASVDFAAVTRVGTTVNSLVAAPGMNPTYLVDIIRVLDLTITTFNGCALSIIGGTEGANRGTFAQIAAADRATGNQQAHGILRELAAGSYGCQGPLRFGDGIGTTSSWFEDINAVLVFESRGFRTTLYKIFITDNGTGTTTFKLTDCALIAPTGVGASFDSLTDTDVTAVTVTGTRIDGFTGGVGVGGGAGQVFTNCIFSNGGAVSVTSQSVNLTGSSVTGSTVAANASALVWNVNTNPNGLLDNMTFSKGTNAHHAIEFGTSSPLTITLTGIDFTGFSASQNNDASIFHIKRTSGAETVTITLVDCTSDASFDTSFRTDGAAVEIVQGTVTTLINIKDFDGNNEEGVSVYLEAADASGDLPYQQSITSITRSGSGPGSTATVTFATDHGLKNNEYLKLEGITDIDNQSDLSGAFQVTVTGPTTLTYTTATTGPSPYNGTIVGTGATIYGMTDANGNISSSRSYSGNQPLTGYARKSDDGVTYFKSIDLDDTVDSSNGLTINRRLVEDGLV